MIKYLFLFFLISPFSTFAESAEIAKEMNGYRLDSFENFESEWKLVTVRYRKDTREMRFTYANPLAWKSLKDGATEYPDGAIFAKIGFISQEDPAFPSSEVPRGARRFQFMVRDKQKFESTSGWGYALFNSEGNLFPEDPKIQEVACAKCHNIVKNKGAVFSEILKLSSKEVHVFPPKSEPTFYKAGFVTIKAIDLPKSILSHIPAKIKKLRSFQGGLDQNLFQGTLDEIKPLLIKEVINSEFSAAILFNEESERFSIVAKNPKNKTCQSNQISLLSIVSQHLKLMDTERKVLVQNFCYDKESL